MSRDNFIEQSKQIYGNYYDYRNVSDIELHPFNNIPIFCPNVIKIIFLSINYFMKRVKKARRAIKKPILIILLS